MKHSVIIVNFNGADDLDRCLTELTKSSTADMELIVVDNASSDHSAEVLRRYSPFITCIESEKNLGFGGGANLGFTAAEGELLTILNNDIQINMTSINKLGEVLENSPQVSCVAPRLILADGSTQKTCRELPYLLGEIAELFGLASILPETKGGYLLGQWGHLNSRKVEQVAGAAFTVRAATFAELGGFDERFPLYYEDVDLCARLRQFGDILYVHEIRAQHTHEGTARKYRERTTAAIAVAKYRYFRYHKGRLQAEFIRALGIVRSASRILALAPSARGTLDARRKISGYLTALKLLMWKPLDYNPLSQKS